jgi:hypothetical protein
MSKYPDKYYTADEDGENRKGPFKRMEYAMLAARTGWWIMRHQYDRHGKILAVEFYVEQFPGPTGWMPVKEWHAGEDDVEMTG